MRKVIAIAALLLVAVSAGAQARSFTIGGNKPLPDSLRLHHNALSNYSVKEWLTNKLARPVGDTLRLPYNGMPNAIIYRSKPDIYVGNNGQGQDIYRSQLDNMSILKPDSTFYSAMPMDTRTLRGSRVLDGNEKGRAQTIATDPAKKQQPNSSSRD